MELLPFVPELLADLWDLGSWPDIIGGLLEQLGLDRNATRALDLGSGKGAVSIHLAKHLGFKTHGIDFFEPFVLDARRRAVEHGVQHLCTFELADMREAVGRHRGFDVAIYASIGSVLGDLAHCVGSIRETVRPGGYIILDDGYLSGTAPVCREGFGHYVPQDVAVGALTAHGDELLDEVHIPVEDVCAMNRRYTDHIARRASQIADRNPRLAPALTDYVEWERVESQALETWIESAVWLLRRV